MRMVPDIANGLNANEQNVKCVWWCPPGDNRNKVRQVTRTFACLFVFSGFTVPLMKSYLCEGFKNSCGFLFFLEISLKFTLIYRLLFIFYTF